MPPRGRRVSLPTAHSVTRGIPVTDSVALTYEARLLRRKRLTSAAGRDFLVDLPKTVSLNDADVFVLDDGTHIGVSAAPEELVCVKGDALNRIAWHIGNRHTPCQIETDRLLIARDHVLEAMLSQLGADMMAVHEPFTPEGGAYGHGRTFGHDHGHGHTHDH